MSTESCPGGPRPRLATVLMLLALASLLSCLPASSAHAAGDANMSACPPETEASPGFRSYLPDCRAYELVTPPYTQGATVEPVAVSADGSRLIGKSLGDFAGAESYEFNSFYEFARTTAGWSTVALDPPASDPRFATFEYLTASSDLSSSLWGGDGELYIRDEPSPGQPRFTEIGPTGHFAGASDDLDHVVIARRPGELFPGDHTTSGQSLYEYAGVDSTEPRLVAVLNAGPLHGSPHVNEGAQLIGECGAELGSAGSEDTYDAVSSGGGEAVFFTALHGSCAQPSVNELYARVDGSSTVDVSEPLLPAGEQCTGACASAVRSEGVFQGASADGSKVFFLTAQPLLNADRDSSSDLYEAELSGGALRRLVMVSEGETRGYPSEDDATPGEGANVLGVVRVSQDGSRVYFVAEGALTRAHNSEGALAVAGERNLYVFDTLTGRTTFVATLASEAEELAARATCSSLPLASSEREACNGNLQPSMLQIWRAQDARSAQATPDGRFLAFLSLAHLTADDSSGPIVAQLFEYDAEDGKLVRASIGEGAEDGNTNVAQDAPHIPQPIYDGALTEPRLSVSDEGTVLFESAASLTAQAQSGHANVYEYSGGRVYLISDGHDATVGESGVGGQVPLIAGDASGQDVFIQSGDPLVPQATGTQVSWYDARLDGGFPAPASASECAEACESPRDFSPPASAPATASYVGGENAPSPAAAPGKPRPLTRAQKLARALKACRDKRGRPRRTCEALARRRYATKAAQARGSTRGRR